MKNKDKILEIIEKTNITQLIHFTKKQNIGSILKNGLLSINELKKRNINYLYNDPERKDNWDSAFSLSVTFVLLMFFWISLSVGSQIKSPSSGRASVEEHCIPSPCVVP